MMPGMVRFAVLAVCVLAACSKSAGNQDKVISPPSPSGGQDVAAMPQGSAPTMGGAAKAGAGPVEAAPAPGADDDRLRLHPDEGTLAVEAPADAKAGAEAVAKITVKPGKGFHVNTEYPIKLTLTPSSGVALAKTDFAAGGHDKGKGDADALDEQNLAFAVKLTPSAGGNYTVSGKFKFAVCDANQCLPKKESISITLAAK
jgi:DsbC/DsbD-like thiol-disulfide interchange protein